MKWNQSTDRRVMRYLICAAVLIVFVSVARTDPTKFNPSLTAIIVTSLALVLGSASTTKEGSDDRRRNRPSGGGDKSPGARVDQAISKVREMVQVDEGGDDPGQEDDRGEPDSSSARHGLWVSPSHRFYWCY